MNRLRKLLVSGFGTGYLPVAPGSWGSAGVAAIWLTVDTHGGDPGDYAAVLRLSGARAVEIADAVFRSKKRVAARILGIVLAGECA